MNTKKYVLFQRESIHHKINENHLTQRYFHREYKEEFIAALDIRDNTLKESCPCTADWYVYDGHRAGKGFAMQQNQHACFMAFKGNCAARRATNNMGCTGMRDGTCMLSIS
jgi:hypothetical protein